MKAVFALLATSLLLSSVSFAGPEEHLDAQRCFVLQGAAPAAVPQKICIENITLRDAGMSVSSISVYSYFYGHLLNGMQLSYIARRNENGFSFKAENMISREYDPGCGASEIVTLKISGRSDNDGLVEVPYVYVSATVESTNDTCHSAPEATDYQYKLQ